MERKVNLTVGQLLASATTILVAFLAAWISLTGRVRALEVGSEIRFQQIEGAQERTDNKFDMILSELGEIKLTLKDKQDRE